MSDDKIDYSKKGKRKITHFVAEELLYDYVTNHLDDERKKAVEEYIQGSTEAQLEIQRIKQAIIYAGKLSNTNISDVLVDKVKEPTHFLDRILRKTGFEEWPLSVKVGFEFLIVSIGVVSVILVIPWHRLMEINFNKNRDIILFEMEKAKKQQVDEIPPPTVAQSEVLYPDEDPKKKGTVTAEESKKQQTEDDKKIPVTQELPVVESKPKEVVKETKSEKKTRFSISWRNLCSKFTCDNNKVC